MCVCVLGRVCRSALMLKFLRENVFSFFGCIKLKGMDKYCPTSNECPSYFIAPQSPVSGKSLKVKDPLFFCVGVLKMHKSQIEGFDRDVTGCLRLGNVRACSLFGLRNEELV